MKKKLFDLMMVSMLLLSGCTESSNKSSSIDDRDSKIVEVYDAYKANGGTLDYDAWLSTIKGEKGDTGSKGDDGSSLISGKGVPSSDIGHDGDSYVDTDTWDYYIKNNGSWVLNGNIKGSKGDTGEAGSRGEKGDTGAQGPKGDKGDAGEKGDKGDKGEDAITYVPVIFNNWDGSKLYEFYYEKGTEVKYDGPEPTRPDETDPDTGETIHWTFAGWDKDQELLSIQKPVIVTAVYQCLYTCTFNNWDGTELYRTQVNRGEDAFFEGETPIRPSEVSGDQTIEWKFIGWDKSLNNITADTVFTAVYDAPNAIKCTFKNEDGIVLGIQYVGKNAKVTYEGETPKKDEVNHGDGTITKYFFEGWDKSTKNLIGDTVFTATFSETTYYECKFYDGDGSLLYTTSTFAGGEVEYKGKTPTKEQEVDGTTITDYIFNYWDESLTNIIKPTNFKPVFIDNQFKGYKVTFVDSKNPEFNYSHYYQENTYARNPFANYWSYDNNEVTLFMGWDKDISSVTQEMTVNAVYKTIPINKNGVYPQSKVTNKTLITTLDGIKEIHGNGYYEYQNEKFKKVYVPYWSTEYYYYKVEPIQWRFFSQSGGKPMFVSEYILENRAWNETKHEEGIYMNNYKYSDIRKWLNNDFLDTAFSDDSLIEPTIVDNSVASTGADPEYEHNSFVCENTNDKVFLLSSAEVTN